MIERAHGVWRWLRRVGVVFIASISVAGAQSQPNPPTGLSAEGGASVPGTPPPAGLVFFDDFNYVVNKMDSGAAKQAAFTAAGWTGLKDEQTAPMRARGYLSTVNSIPGYSGRIPGRSGRALRMEGLPTTFDRQYGGGNQTDFYLFYGTPGPVGRTNPPPALPGNVWFQFWVYVNDYGVERTHWSNRNKLIYPSDDGTASGDGTENAYMLHMRPSNQAGMTQPYGASVNAVTHVEGAVVESPTPEGPGRLGHNLTQSGYQLPNRWYLHKVHVDHSQEHGVYETWIRPMGGSWIKTSEWRSGITPGFTWITHSRLRAGHNMFKMPTTWGTAQEDDSTNYDAWLYMSDFAVATRESDLPAYDGY